MISFEMESSSSDSSWHEPAQLPVGREINACLDIVQPSVKGDTLRKQTNLTLSVPRC